MEKNVGKTDKTIRLILGLVLLVLAFAWKCWICLIVGLILIVTGVLQKCPLYKLMGKSTCEVKK